MKPPPEVSLRTAAGPAGCGRDRVHWTSAALAPSFYQTTGSTVSETTMRTFCIQHWVRPYRPTSPYRQDGPYAAERGTPGA